MKGFYHIWAWQPSWSCDLDFLYTHWFPLPINASYKIWLWLAKRFQRRRSLKLWTDDGRTDDDGRTTDGRTPDHGHPISSPCEPNGSGELKICKHLKTIALPTFKATFSHCMYVKWYLINHSGTTNKVKGDNNTNMAKPIQG